VPFSDFIGNSRIVESIQRMIAEDRLPQTMLFAGQRGVGKATLARYLAAAVNCRDAKADFCGKCSSCTRMLAADLSVDEYQKQFEEREKLPAAKRGEAPLIVSTHPDFLIFPPDGPMRILTVEQARQLRTAARYNPSEARRRVFLIDEADRANDEAANSLLKTLEEPAPALTIILTAESPYELLPTIRSRTVQFFFTPLSTEEMDRFFETRSDFDETQRRRLSGWAQGSPGRALGLDVDEYLWRRDAMLDVLKTSLGAQSFAELIGKTEAVARRGREKLELLIEMLFSLLGDLLHLRHGSGGLVNADIREDLRELSEKASFEWFERASLRLEELEEWRRRNVGKQAALEAFALELRRVAARR